MALFKDQGCAKGASSFSLTPSNLERYTFDKRVAARRLNAKPMSKFPQPTLKHHVVIKKKALCLIVAASALLLMAAAAVTMSSIFASSLDQIQVLGTVMGNKPSSSYAIIAIGNDEASHYKKGQTVIPGYQLHKILEDKIVLKHADKTIKIKIGVPFSAEDFNVESALPPDYNQAPESTVPLSQVPDSERPTMPPPPPVQSIDPSYETNAPIDSSTPP